MSKKIHLICDVYVLIDEEDYDELQKYTWYLGKFRALYCAERFEFIDEHYTSIMMHRQIMGLKRGDKKGVKHLNGNGLDNRRKNLCFSGRYPRKKRGKNAEIQSTI